jgi:hypothetical protein
LPLRWRLIALALFAVVMLGVGFLAHWISYDLIPAGIIGYVAVAMGAFFAGVIAGESATLRSIRKRGRAATDERD